MTKKTVKLTLLCVALAVLIGCIAYFVNGRVKQNKTENLIESAKINTEEDESDSTKVQVPVDFEKLKKANSDIYAWINIEALGVDYPILQSETDNSYYLNHTVNGEKSVYGSIFTENYNSKDFSDFNTVIYGHNMKNGTMFGSLKKFRDAAFFNENRYINIYLEGRILKYEIFAACTWDNKHILLTRNFETKYNRQVYLDEIFAVRDVNSQIKQDIEVTESDKIITLSTCMNNDSKRFIVSGVLVYDSAQN